MKRLVLHWLLSVGFTIMNWRIMRGSQPLPGFAGFMKRHLMAPETAARLGAHLRYIVLILLIVKVGSVSGHRDPGGEDIDTSMDKPGMQVWGVKNDGASPLFNEGIAIAEIPTEGRVFQACSVYADNIIEHGDPIVPWALEGHENYTMNNLTYKSKFDWVTPYNAEGLLGAWQFFGKEASFQGHFRGSYGENDTIISFKVINNYNPWESDSLEYWHYFSIHRKGSNGIRLINFVRDSERSECDTVDLTFDKFFFTDASRWHTFDIRLDPVSRQSNGLIYDTIPNAFTIKMIFDGDTAKPVTSADTTRAIDLKRLINSSVYWSKHYFEDIEEFKFKVHGEVADFGISIGGSQAADSLSKKLLYPGSLVHQDNDTVPIYDEFKVPQILSICYAPPGDQSKASNSESYTIKESRTISAGIAGHHRVGLGASLEPSVFTKGFGLEAEIGFSIDASTSGAWTTETQRTLTTETTISGGQDYALVQDITVIALLIARPRLNNLGSVIPALTNNDNVPDGFVTDIQFISSKPAAWREMTIQELIQEFEKDTLFGRDVINNLRELYAKEIELRDSGWAITGVKQKGLAYQGPFEFSGGINTEQTIKIEEISTKTSKQAFNLKVGFYQNLKVSKCFVSVSNDIELSVESGVTWEKSSTESKTFTYTLCDDDNYDFFKGKVYKDERLGLLIFQCDEEESYSSGPHEPGTKPAVAFETTLSNYIQSPKTGDTIVCTLTVKNVSERDFKTTVKVEKNSVKDNYHSYEIIEEIMPSIAFIDPDSSVQFSISYKKVKETDMSLPLRVIYGYGEGNNFHRLGHVSIPDDAEQVETEDDLNYHTIQYADIDGDGGYELLARDSSAVAVFQHTSGEWHLIWKDSLPGWSKSDYLKKAEYYETIQAADIDGDGAAELLARGSAGMHVWEYAENRWKELGRGPAWTDDGSWNNAQYYTTIQTADIDGDKKEELLARSAAGIVAWKYHQDGWQELPSGPEWSDEQRWNSERFYRTIQAGDIDGNGAKEVLARGSGGIVAWKYSREDGWQELPNGPRWSCWGGWDKPIRYQSIRCADVNNDGKEELVGNYGYMLGAYTFDSATHAWVVATSSMPVARSKVSASPRQIQYRCQKGLLSIGLPATVWKNNELTVKMIMPNGRTVAQNRFSRLSNKEYSFVNMPIPSGIAHGMYILVGTDSSGLVFRKTLLYPLR